MNANTCIFAPDTMTINGISFPVGYSIPPHGDGSVFVFVQQGEQRIRIRITPDDPHHAAALAAARPDPDRPTDKPTEQPADLVEQAQEEQPAADPTPAQEEQPAADPEPAQEEQPANPDKQAHGTVPEKTWIGTSIQGNGWKIEFCPIFERTRLIFDRIPTKEARELVKAAGFAWSPKMGSWNKRLTWKAYRAAQQLAADLANLTRRAC